MTIDVRVTLMVRADTEPEAEAAAWLRIARRYPTHWEQAQVVRVVAEEWLPRGWNVMFRLPTLTVAEAIEGQTRAWDEDAA